MDEKYTVIVADSDVMRLNTMGNVLFEIGYKVLSTASDEAFFKCLKNNWYDLILLDASMRCANGCLILNKLKANIKYSNVPVILMISDANFSISQVYEMGASDYIREPFERAELKSRIKTHIELKTYNDTLARLSGGVSRAYKELETVKNIINSNNKEFNAFIRELDHASKTDFLTGLFNRRYMLDRINDEVTRAKSTGRPFAILIGDLDFFKKVNDTYGHDCGDKVLKSVSKTFKESVREHDYVARWGGEEFLLLIVEVTDGDALEFAERIRNKVANMTVYCKGERIGITITMGVSVFNPGSDSADSIIKRADSALYAGKKSGRNKCVLQ